MKQLKLIDVLAFASQLQKQGMSKEELYNLPIYIGNDDELNGIHCAWFTNLVDSNNMEDEDNEYIVEIINERRGNIKLEGKALLIS